MARYIIKRLLLMIPVLLGVTILIFTIMYFAKGDPAQMMLGSNATPESIEAKREELGLNDPYIVRLGRYMRDVFLHFDFGKSYINGRSVAGDILSKIPNTFTIALLSVALALLIGIPLGVIAATHQNKLADRISMIISFIGVSMPGFWVALLLLIVFALNLRWFPVNGTKAGAISFVLPCIACALNGVASLARQTRSSMLEVIRSDYVVTARAKGQSERKVIYSHALRNALIPIITSAGGIFGSLMGGALVIETVFGIPGLGMYMVSSINNRDYPCIQGGVICIAIAFGFLMLFIDLIYAFVDPRIKAQYAEKKG